MASQTVVDRSSWPLGNRDLSLFAINNLKYMTMTMTMTIGVFYEKKTEDLSPLMFLRRIMGTNVRDVNIKLQIRVIN